METGSLPLMPGRPSPGEELPRTVSPTDFIPQAELARLLSRAGRIAQASIWIEDSEGDLLAGSADGGPGPATHQVSLEHGGEKFGSLAGRGGAELAEVLAWTAETILDKVKSGLEIDNLAQHVAENYEELNCLFDLIRSLPSLTSLDIVQSCRAVLESTRALVKAERAWLLIAHEGRDELTVLKKEGEGEVRRSAYCMDAPRQGPWEHCCETGKPINAASMDDLPAGIALREDLGLFLPLVCLSLEADGQPYGVLCFSGRTGTDFFSSTEVKLANTVGAHTGSLLSNARLYEHVRSLFLGAITALSNAIESRDEYTHGHVERVTEYAASIAGEMGFDPERIELIRISATMHDLGKIGIPDDVLLKEGSLTDAEREVMKKHTLVGPKILEGIKKLEPLVPWIRGHHERPDGTGYPYGLRDTEIPVEAQILAVADAFDAMTSDRSYRKALPPQEAANRLLEGQGAQFSSEVVQAFLRTPEYRELVGPRK